MIPKIIKELEHVIMLKELDVLNEERKYIHIQNRMACRESERKDGNSHVRYNAGGDKNDRNDEAEPFIIGKSKRDHLVMRLLWNWLHSTLMTTVIVWTLHKYATVHVMQYASN
ncbi:hypothetical protein ACJMK2_021319 [Sinanodonta woodiana]|uniref:Uncharacterized protein n=1 Tax=Sinanodonta woodiana TaxID=1069815 RepID=A0ABD3THM9_SINWO